MGGSTFHITFQIIQYVLHYIAGRRIIFLIAQVLYFYCNWLRFYLRFQFIFLFQCVSFTRKEE